MFDDFISQRAGEKGMGLTSIAFIPDGNRRFAQNNMLSLSNAYAAGTQKAWDVVDWLNEYPKITVGTFWALSNENLNRSFVEKKLLFKIFEREIDRAKDNGFFEANQIRLKFVGRLAQLPDQLKTKMAALEKGTENFSAKTMNIALGYGGRAEIVDAAKKVAEDYKNNGLDLDTLTEERFKEYLYKPFQDPDLIVRTSGTQRLSGFLPYQSAYSELYFCPKFWPEFSEQDLAEAVSNYEKRDRRYGK